MDKFSELIAKGVAAFETRPVAPAVPAACPICRAYNNIFSIATDTHMSPQDDGTFVITGHLIGSKNKFDQFQYANYYGGVNFGTAGYWSFSDFMRKNDLRGKYDIMNNEPVYVLSKIQRDENGQIVASDCDCVACSGSFTVGESIIPITVGFLSKNHNVNDVKECFKENVFETTKALNESRDVIGKNWTPVYTSAGVKVACFENNKTIVL